MTAHQCIEQKRDGQEIPAPELEAFFQGYLAGSVQEYQMSAFLMAVLFRGMTSRELDTLLAVMIGSGTSLEWSGMDGPVVDKHSTGGVGDKVSLPLAPLAAELGLVVPMMSGRGLGHTTGTLDKLEAIPGFRTNLSLDEFRRVVRELGVGMIGQTAEIAPLDRRLYDLRGVTGTVPAIPLIATSIMSKKLSEGLQGLVLDVKMGNGAFIQDPAESRLLARTMVGLGQGRGVRTHALLTAMNRPLGVAIGNAMETREAIQCLRGEGPADLRELVLLEVVEMMVVGGLADDTEEGRRRARARATDVLGGGGPLERFGRLIRAQGGDEGVLEDLDRLPTAKVVRPVDAVGSGVVTGIDARRLGQLVVRLGGGRVNLGDQIDLGVGIRSFARPGDTVSAGDVVAEVHARSEDEAHWAVQEARKAYRLGESAANEMPLLVERVEAG